MPNESNYHQIEFAVPRRRPFDGKVGSLASRFVSVFENTRVTDREKNKRMKKGKRMKRDRDKDWQLLATRHLYKAVVFSGLLRQLSRRRRRHFHLLASVNTSVYARKKKKSNEQPLICCAEIKCTQTVVRKNAVRPRTVTQPSFSDILQSSSNV